MRQQEEQPRRIVIERRSRTAESGILFRRFQIRGTSRLATGRRPGQQLPQRAVNAVAPELGAREPGGRLRQRSARVRAGKQPPNSGTEPRHVVLDQERATVSSLEALHSARGRDAAPFR